MGGLIGFGNEQEARKTSEGGLSPFKGGNHRNVIRWGRSPVVGVAQGAGVTVVT